MLPTRVVVGFGVRSVEGGEEDGSQAPLYSVGVAMAMAVDICCAITQPTIFSRSVDVMDGVRNK